MEKVVTTRVSEAQWALIIDFLESNPNLARFRGYNNSAKGRAVSSRLWEQQAKVLNATDGAIKSPKDWSIYVSNYKSKLKKLLDDSEAAAKSGGPSLDESLSDISEWDKRFLTLLGVGGLTVPEAPIKVWIDPFSDEEPQPTKSKGSSSKVEVQDCDYKKMTLLDMIVDSPEYPASSGEIQVKVVNVPPTVTKSPKIQKPVRQRRFRGRPLAPSNEARKAPIPQLGMNSQALNLIGENLGRLATAFERYVDHITGTSESQ